MADFHQDEHTHIFLNPSSCFIHGMHVISLDPSETTRNSLLRIHITRFMTETRKESMKIHTAYKHVKGMYK